MAEINTAAATASPGAAARAHLSVFVGKWRTAGKSFAEGQRFEDPRASAVPWTSDEIYEWLPGGHFLMHRWDAMVGTYPFKGIEIIGFDESKGGFFSHLFDNAGNHGEYRGEYNGNIWKFNESKTRSVITISSGGQEMEVTWQWTNGGREWLPLCERHARRLMD